MQEISGRKYGKDRVEAAGGKERGTLRVLRGYETWRTVSWKADPRAAGTVSLPSQKEMKRLEQENTDRNEKIESDSAALRAGEGGPGKTHPRCFPKSSWKPRT